MNRKEKTDISLNAEEKRKAGEKGERLKEKKRDGEGKKRRSVEKGFVISV